MTTPTPEEVHQTVEAIQVMRASHTFQTHGIGVPDDCDEVVAFQALEAVLAMPEKPNGSYPFLPGYQRESAVYNQALAEMRQIINKALGVSE